MGAVAGVQQQQQLNGASCRSIWSLPVSFGKQIVCVNWRTSLKVVQVCNVCQCLIWFSQRRITRHPFYYSNHARLSQCPFRFLLASVRSSGAGR